MVNCEKRAARGELAPLVSVQVIYFMHAHEKDVMLSCSVFSLSDFVGSSADLLFQLHVVCGVSLAYHVSITLSSNWPVANDTFLC